MIKPKYKHGYTTRNHLLVDLDNSSLLKAQCLAVQLINQYHKLGDCLIVQSSIKKDNEYLKYSKYGTPMFKRERSGYHLIFGGRVGFNTCLKIISMLSDLDIIQREHKKIRLYYRDMTLRTSCRILSNRIEAPPKVLGFFINPYTDEMIDLTNDYLWFLELSWNEYQGCILPKPIWNKTNPKPNKIEAIPKSKICDTKSLVSI